MGSVQQPLKHIPLSPALPMYLTTFVGREQESATLSSLLSEKRLLTLIGAGGMGKTRLALHLASTMAASFPDGVFFIELGPLTEPTLVSQATASVLNIRTDQDSSLFSLLTSALQDHHCLLLFDNCEHVLEASIPLIEVLLQCCPHLHVLATSREPLNIAEETLWRVASLGCPEPEPLPPFPQLAQYEAIQLFCARATESNPRFQFTEQNASAIVRICYQLDGLPLALELAAARLSMLSVDQLAARLDERFLLLARGQRTATSRQQTLHATLDWSYTLLTPAEQALFQCLAVFAGNWNLDDIEQIAGAETTAPYAISNVLTHLVNKSLVIAEEQEGTETEAGEIRYRLLNTVHQYATSKLMQSGNWQRMCEQHQAWYLQQAEEANKHLRGPEQFLWLQYLEAGLPNIRVALTRALAARQLATAIQLAEEVRRFWISRNYFSEGRHWFETLLTAAHNDEQLSPSLRAYALFGASEFARYQGANEHASILLKELITLLETLDEPLRLVEAQTYLGLNLCLQGEYEQANQLCQASLAFYREQKQMGGVIQALMTLSLVALCQGKYPQAITMGEEVSQLLRRAGNYAYLLYTLFTLAQANILQGKLEPARTVCQEALDLSQKLNQSFGLAASLGLIAGIAGLQGEPIQAARLFGASHALQKRAQAPFSPSSHMLQERMVFPVRSALGKDQFLAHYNAGQDSSLEQIMAEATTVLQASTILSAADPALSSSSSTPIITPLSQRERETLTLVAQGLTDAQVAQNLRLSPNTISKHLHSIYSKLNINSRSAATRIALEQGLI